MDDRQPHAAVSHSRGGRTNARADRRNGRGRGVSGGGGGGGEGAGEDGRGRDGARGEECRRGASLGTPETPPRQ